MLVSTVAAIVDRELKTVRRELEAYPDDHLIWRILPGVPNSGGTLALHLAGNLQHYIGAQLGRTGYVRDRPAEFARRDVPRAELLEELETARAAVGSVLARLKDEDLPKQFPEIVGGVRVDTEEYLVHLLVHLAYHLGQLDTHRRVVTGDASGVGAVRQTELGTARPTAG
ncbi:MAG: DinB family protein [Gemmatimonadales bacterium]